VLPPVAPTVLKNGAWPFYAPLYAYGRPVFYLINPYPTFNGSLQGWLYFTNGSLGGDLTWVKTSWTNGYYDSGFTNEISVLGSPYTTPPLNTRALAITNGTAVVEGGNLSTPFINNLIWNSNNTVTVLPPTNNAQKISVTLLSGLLTSTFNHPDLSNKLTTANGVLLQNRGEARGFFLGTNQAG